MAYDVEQPLRERIKHARLPEDVERGIGGLHLAASGIDCRSEAILRWAYGGLGVDGIISTRNC